MVAGRVVVGLRHVNGIGARDKPGLVRVAGGSGEARMRGSDYHSVARGIARHAPVAGVFSIDTNRRAGHARLRSLS